MELLENFEDSNLPKHYKRVPHAEVHLSARTTKVPDQYYILYYNNTKCITKPRLKLLYVNFGGFWVDGSWTGGFWGCTYYSKFGNSCIFFQEILSTSISNIIHKLI